MPYIRTIEPEDADGELREEYERLLGSRGKLAAIHTIHSLSPKALRAHTDLYLTLITAYFNFVNRIAQGLGVEVSAGEATGYRY